MMNSEHKQETNRTPKWRTCERLLAQARSPNVDERFEAISELTYCESPEVDEALVEGATDLDPDVAGIALEALSERGHPKAREIILDHLHNRPSLRQSALRAAGVVDIGPHLQEAWQALERREWFWRTAGAGALAKAGAVAALPKIRELAQRARLAHQLEAEAQLLGSAGLLGHKESADLFLLRLSSRTGRSHRSAGYFLERKGRLQDLAGIVGVSRLRSALLRGKQFHDRRFQKLIADHPKTKYSTLFEDLLQRVDKLDTTSDDK
ncbi:MAG: HEAT repeat domain-containing protein [Chloroflexi bacterium]|nr:HEAT repeat domain-containing protein [Chloroflexota bacterium]